jgi:hypothetical protein
MAKRLIPKNVKELVPDLGKWPESWMGTEKDLEYGKKLLPFMEKFIHCLMGQGLSRKTLKDYVDWVWLLGGGIIKEVSLYRNYKKDPAKKLLETVEGGGCPPGDYESMAKSELAGFKKMCGHFEEFLKKTPKGNDHAKNTTTRRNLYDLQCQGNQKRGEEAPAEMFGEERG